MLSDFNSDEAGRLLALDRLEIMDTPKEQPFERIVTLVRDILQVPICAVSLVDQDRQWFKASRGLAVSETPRNISFCSHTIQGANPFVICDAERDRRFAENPLVTGDPHIRSYAGVPLKTADGYNLGSLCAIDTKPREFSTHELSILDNFAKLVVDQLELRRIASIDALTGVMSRRAWLELSREEVLRSARYGRPLAILIVDVDHFKSINDDFGHPAGDMVLRQLAQLSAALLRNSDGFGRFGGEEFVAVLPETKAGDAMTMAERLREAVGREVFDCLGGRPCTVSIGVADLLPGETDVEPILERADQALYRAKACGRNCSHLETTTIHRVAA